MLDILTHVGLKFNKNTKINYKENFLMKKILKIDKLVKVDNKKFTDAYDYAHNEALEFYNVSPFSVYHKDVILQNEDDFNFNWLKFWNNLDK